MQEGHTDSAVTTYHVDDDVGVRARSQGGLNDGVVLLVEESLVDRASESGRHFLPCKCYGSNV